MFTFHNIYRMAWLGVLVTRAPFPSFAEINGGELGHIYKHLTAEKSLKQGSSPVL